MIFAILARWGVPQKLIAPLLGLGALLLIWLCVALWLHFHDRKVIDSHEAGITAEIATATNAANDVANTKEAERRENDARADEQLREAIRDAETKHPIEVRHDAGPATSATLDRLRQRAPSPRPSAH